MKTFLTFLWILISISTIFAQTKGDQLFAEDVLHEIRIESDVSDLLDVMFNNYFLEFPGDYSYLPATVTIDGQVIDSVGVRVKGGISAFEEKKPLKLDFNEFIAGQEYDQIRKVNLHNAVLDKSMQRETISYEVLRYAGLKTPRTAYAQVYINDELQGLYALVEQIDKTFLNNYFADENGALYKTKECEVRLISDEGTMEPYNKLLETLNNFSGTELKDTLDKILDTEALLRSLAVQNVMNTVDNILTTSCNYYIYHEPKADLMYFIPWDFNFSFLPNPNHPIDLIAESSIAEQFLQTPVFEERYREIFCEILDYNFTESRLFEILDRRKSLIDNAVQTDPYIEFTFEEYEAENELVKNWISTRIGQVQANLDALNETCEPLVSPIGFQDITINEIIASSDSVAGIADPDGGYPDWIELYNNTDEAISLAGFYLSDDRDFMKHWAFPSDAVIAANDYLIVWADRDLDETGLHADFKLSRKGGDVFLIYDDFTMIDEVTYDEQEKNIAYARIPNGTGDFVQQAATFSASNEVDTSIETPNSAIQWSVFPNPTSDKFEITLPASFANQDYSISIIDVYGRSQFIENTLSFSVANYPAGVYWIRLLVDGKTMTKKMIVE